MYWDCVSGSDSVEHKDDGGLGCDAPTVAVRWYVRAGLHGVMSQRSVMLSDRIMFREVSKCGEQALHANFFYARVQATMRQMLKYRADYSQGPHNDVSVNDGPHIRWWSHKIII
jgi:hypothetical protein